LWQAQRTTRRASARPGPGLASGRDALSGRAHMAGWAGHLALSGFPDAVPAPAGMLSAKFHLTQLHWGRGRAVMYAPDMGMRCAPPRGLGTLAGRPGAWLVCRERTARIADAHTPTEPCTKPWLLARCRRARWRVGRAGAGSARAPRKRKATHPCPAHPSRQEGDADEKAIGRVRGEGRLQGEGRHPAISAVSRPSPGHCSLQHCPRGLPVAVARCWLRHTGRTGAACGVGCTPDRRARRDNIARSAPAFECRCCNHRL
jgi:hypothetical protein